MVNNREENWINYFAGLGEPNDRGGVELAKVAEKLGLTADDLAEFVEAAQVLKKKIRDADQLGEASVGSVDGWLALAL